ncbi:hypothetical protein Q0O06_29875, partial [Bacillus thuringiensis]|uniref:hypothetical protein n=1 Tax=Bacillus thuringiensis TaxID=1428 RepID=UPI00345A16AB
KERTQRARVRTREAREQKEQTLLAKQQEDKERTQRARVRTREAREQKEQTLLAKQQEDKERTQRARVRTREVREHTHVANGQAAQDVNKPPKKVHFPEEGSVTKTKQITGWQAKVVEKDQQQNIKKEIEFLTEDNGNIVYGDEFIYGSNSQPLNGWVKLNNVFYYCQNSKIVR